MCTTTFFVYNTHMMRKLEPDTSAPAKHEWIDLSVRIHACTFTQLDRWQSGDLAAPHWRLYWNADHGAGVLRHNKRIALTPGRFMVIPPETSFTTHLRNPVRHFYLHFTVHPHMYTPYMIHTFTRDGSMASALTETTEMLLAEKTDTLRLSVLTQYLAYSALERIPRTQLRHAYADDRIERVIRRLQDTPGKLHSNEELARSIGMNTNAFVRLFREVTGETPRALLLRLRIEQACLELHHTDETIDDIAATLGFCDRYHFSRTFSRLRGMGPAAFRRLRATG